MKDYELEAIRARAHYKAARKIADSHPSSPYKSQAERARDAQAARAREEMMREVRRPVSKEWSNDYPSYVKTTQEKPDGCKELAAILLTSGAAVLYLLTHVLGEVL